MRLCNSRLLKRGSGFTNFGMRAQCAIEQMHQHVFVVPMSTILFEQGGPRREEPVGRGRRGHRGQRRQDPRRGPHRSSIHTSKPFDLEKVGRLKLILGGFLGKNLGP